MQEGSVANPVDCPGLVRGGRSEKKPETWLYAPIKRHLESLGFEVKGEIGHCDFVAVDTSTGSVVIIGELKSTFTLDLLLQGIDRSTACDEVWLVIGMSKRGGGREKDRRVHKLCRRLGFGLFGVDTEGAVHILAPPGPYTPRGSAKRRSALLSEHRRRQGDPVLGGSTTGEKRLTAYRQEALRIAMTLESKPLRPRDLRDAFPSPKVSSAKTIMDGLSPLNVGYTRSQQKADRRSKYGAMPLHHLQRRQGRCRARTHSLRTSHQLMENALNRKASAMTSGELRELMEFAFGAGWQSNLARLSGISRSQINRYANGVDIPQHVAFMVHLLVAAIDADLDVPLICPIENDKRSAREASDPAR